MTTSSSSVAIRCSPRAWSHACAATSKSISPLRKLFELPTVAGLAEHIDFLRRNQSGIIVPPIVPVHRDQPIPLSFSQRRFWFLQKLDPELMAYNIPATFRITGALNVPALEQALGEIVNRHEILRTRIVEIDGQPLQENHSDVTLKLRSYDLSRLPRAKPRPKLKGFLPRMRANLTILPKRRSCGRNWCAFAKTNTF